MKRFFLAVCLLFSALSFGQSFEVSSLIKETSQNGEIQGIILDHEFDNEPLAFADIKVKNTNLSVTSDLDGTFSFSLKPGTYTLVFNFTGYKTVEVQNVKITANAKVNCNQILSALVMEPTFVVSEM